MRLPTLELVFWCTFFIFSSSHISFGDDKSTGPVGTGIWQPQPSSGGSNSGPKGPGSLAPWFPDWNPGPYKDPSWVKPEDWTKPLMWHKHPAKLPNPYQQQQLERWENFVNSLPPLFKKDPKTGEWVPAQTTEPPAQPTKQPPRTRTPSPSTTPKPPSNVGANATALGIAYSVGPQALLTIGRMITNANLLSDRMNRFSNLDEMTLWMKALGIYSGSYSDYCEGFLVDRIASISSPDADARADMETFIGFYTEYFKLPLFQFNNPRGRVIAALLQLKKLQKDGNFTTISNMPQNTTEEYAARNILKKMAEVNCKSHYWPLYMEALNKIPACTYTTPDPTGKSDDKVDFYGKYTNVNLHCDNAPKYHTDYLGVVDLDTGDVYSDAKEDNRSLPPLGKYDADLPWVLMRRGSSEEATYPYRLSDEDRDRVKRLMAKRKECLAEVLKSEEGDKLCKIDLLNLEPIIRGIETDCAVLSAQDISTALSRAAALLKATADTCKTNETRQNLRDRYNRLAEAYNSMPKDPEAKNFCDYLSLKQEMVSPE